MPFFHDSWTTATTYTPGPMNAPLADLDYQMALYKNMMVYGAFFYDLSTGFLSWPDGFMIIYTGPTGEMITEFADPGSIELTPLVEGCIVGVDLTLVADADLTGEVYTVPDPWSEEVSPLVVWTTVIFGYADEDGFCPGPLVRDITIVQSGS